MAYIGVSPSNGVRRVHTYTATASQTTFSGAGAEGTSLSYKDSNFVDVYQNGVKLGDADYTSTSGTSIVLAQAASVDDLVVIVVFDVFSVADTVSKADGGTFDGNVTMGGNLTVSGAFTSQGIDDNADATAITISSGEVVTLSNNLITNGNVLRGVDDSSNTLSGGTASNSGSNIAVYGSSHSSLAGNVRFRNGSTQTMLVDSTGAVTIANGLTLTDGNLVVASGHGIDFSATANSSGSMSSELLDDYEEGAFTPTLTSSSGASRAVDAQTSRYTKIGRICYISCAITTIGALSGSNTGTLRLGGLPFNYNGGVSKSVSSDVSFVNVNLPSGIVQTAMLQNSSGTSDNFFFSSTFDDSTVGELGISAFDHTSSLVVSLVYEVA